MAPNFLSPLVHDFMTKSSRELFNAAQSGDNDYALAVLTRLFVTIPSYIDALKEAQEGSK